jgi:hypothetical protein
MEQRRGACRVLVGQTEGKGLLEDLDVDGIVIPELISKKSV